MHCALLIGREGSYGFPGKNVLPVLGRPMMEYPLIAATYTQSLERVYVSTDSEKIKDIARGYSARIIDRPAYLATKQALGEDAFAHGYTVIRDELAKEGRRLETLSLLFCNAPTVTPDLMETGIELLRKHPEADSATSVSIYNMWSPLRARRLNGKGFLDPFVPFQTFGNVETLNCDRDSQGDVYFADMSVSVVRPRCLENLHDGLLPQKWMGRKILPIKQWGGLDVDLPWQIPQVEYWLREHGFTLETIPFQKRNPVNNLAAAQPLRGESSCIP